MKRYEMTETFDPGVIVTKIGASGDLDACFHALRIASTNAVTLTLAHVSVDMEGVQHNRTVMTLQLKKGS